MTTASVADVEAELLAASAEAFANPLDPAGYRVRSAAREEWLPLLDEMRHVAFSSAMAVQHARLGLASERDRWSALEQNSERVQHRLVFMYEDVPVGTYWGRQSGADYEMVSTLLRPEHQGRGVYTEFLKRLIAVVQGVGFRAIRSRHHADNNAALIPKLRTGFHIVGFEIDPCFGLLVQLTRWNERDHALLYQVRVDATRHMQAATERGIIRLAAAPTHE